MKKILVLLTLVSLIVCCCGLAMAENSEHPDQVVLEATCGHKGQKLVWDDEAGQYKMEEIDNSKLKHNFVDKIKPATCTEDKVIGSICSICGAVELDANNKPIQEVVVGSNLGGHIYADQTKWGDSDPDEMWTITEATCKAAGSKTRKCARCGKVETDDAYKTAHPIDPDAHKLGDPVVLEAANCKEQKNGSQKRVCTLCKKDIEYSEIDWNKAHTFGEETIVKAATCVENGLKSKLCSTCGLVVDTVIPADAKFHDYKENTVIEANCIHPKMSGYICTICGAAKPGTTPVIEGESLGGHTWGEDKELVKANCHVPGRWSNTCTVCGETVYWTTGVDETKHDYEVTVIEAASCKDEKNGSQKLVCKYGDHTEYASIPWEHTFGEETIIKAATCVDEGLKTKTCSGCGLVVDTVIPATGKHDYKDTVLEANCEHAKMSGCICTVCGAAKPGTTPVIEGDSLGGHVWGEPEELVEANCHVPGRWSQTCTVCGKVVYWNTGIDPDNHDFEATVLEAANCKEQKNGSRKLVCKYGDHTEYEEIDWHDAHTFSDWTVVKAATCVERGLKNRTCSTCGWTEDEWIDPTGEHDYKDMVREADCTHQKLTGCICSVCGQPKPGTEWKAEGLAPEGHKWSMWLDEVKANCYTTGRQSRTCNVCGEVEYRIRPINENEHDYEATVIEAANCAKQKNGMQKLVCKFCNHTEYEEILWNDAHEFEVEIVKEPTCIEEGKIINRCPVCGLVVNGPVSREQFDLIRATGIHDYQEVARDADCTHPKQIGIFCTVCGIADPEHEDESSSYGEPLGHDWGTDSWVRIEPTCRESGKEYQVCQRCGVTSWGMVDPNNGEDLYYEWWDEDAHDWDLENAVIFEQATCKKEGKYKVTCKICKQEKYDKYNAEHDYDEGVVIITPTCETRGATKYTCQVCGYEDIRFNIPAEHVWEIVYNNGLEFRVCKICGEPRTMDHIDCVPGETEIENEVAPTCTADGSYDEVTYCTVCGKVLSRVRRVAEKAHIPGEPVKENVTATSYDEVIYCTVCKEELSRETKTVETPEPGEKPVYTTNFEFDADEMTLTGKATLTEGDAPKAVYARVTYFMADGTFVVVSVPVEADGTYESMNSGDVIHVSVQIVDCAKVRPGDFTSFSK